jgi:hypothetical protein
MSELDKEIITYLLVEVCEFTKVTMENMEKMGIALNVRKLRYVEDNYWENLVERKIMNEIEMAMIKPLIKWLDTKKSEGLKLPTDVEGWRKLITPDILDDYVTEQKNKSMIDKTIISGGGSSTIQTDVKQEVSKKRNDYMKVKITDFPDFNGKMENWGVFKQKFEALAAFSSFAELLQVKNLDLHLSRRVLDDEYDSQCKILQQVLRKITAGGTALTRVLKNAEVEDGAQSWYDLKKYYDQEGDDKGYGARLIGQLADLKLEYNSYGGMDKYVSEFEKINIELDAIAPLNDNTKKTFFLRGILDRDYITMKDLCKRLTYDETILEMRNKAAELGKTSGNAKRSQNKKTTKYKNDNDSEVEDDDKGEDFTKGAYFPPKIWDQLSPANKKYIMAAKTKNKEKGETKVDFGPQYGKNKEEDEEEKPRKANNVMTVPPNKEPKELVADDITKYQIWRPSK